MKTIWLRRCLAGAGHAAFMAFWAGVTVAAILAAARPALADGGAPNLAYVTSAGANGADLAVIDIGQRHLTGRIRVGGDPAGVVLSIDARFAYVTQAAAGRVAVVDTHAQQVVATVPVGPQPRALALGASAGDTLLYVVESGGNTLTVLDADEERVLAAIPVGKHPMGVAVAGPDSGISNPNDAEVYVTNSESDTVSVISATLRQVVATIQVPGGPLSVVVPATGGVAYVTTRSGDVLALSLAGHQLLGAVLQVPAGQLGTMDFDAVTGEIYVPDAAHGAVYVLRPVSVGSAGAEPSFPREPARTLRLGGGPLAVAVTFEGSYGFVAEQSAGRVAMLDMSTHRTLATIAVGGSPRAIITGPYPPALSGLAGFILNMLVVAFIAVLMASLFLTGRLTASKRRSSSGAGTPGEG